jgi:hypothetical protein
MIQELIRAAHAKYEPLSIETQIISENIDNDVIIFVARVTTDNGTFSAWAKGGWNTPLNEIEDLAIVNALHRANVDTVVGQVEEALFSGVQNYPSIVAKEEAVTSLFQSTIEGNEDAEETIECSDCPNGVQPYYAGTLVLTAQEVAAKTEKRHGRVLCADCSSAAILKPKRKKKD